MRERALAAPHACGHCTRSTGEDLTSPLSSAEAHTNRLEMVDGPDLGLYTPKTCDDLSDDVKKPA